MAGKCQSQDLNHGLSNSEACPVEWIFFGAQSFYPWGRFVLVQLEKVQLPHALRYLILTAFLQGKQCIFFQCPWHPRIWSKTNPRSCSTRNECLSSELWEEPPLPLFYISTTPSPKLVKCDQLEPNPKKSQCLYFIPVLQLKAMCLNFDCIQPNHGANFHQWKCLVDMFEYAAQSNNNNNSFHWSL